VRLELDLLNVFLLVFIRHLDVLAILLEVKGNCLAKSLIVSRECKIQDPVDIVIQCPRQVTMEISVDTLHILQSDLLPQDHLVKSANEKRIQEATVENGKTDNTSDELEVVQMFRVNAGVRVDLQGVVVVCGVFEKTVERIEHLVRKQEEEFSVQLLA
jgi:hypothetical protein